MQVERYANLYANDTQIYGFCRPAAASQLQQQVSVCTDGVALWMRSNWLQPNTTKIKVLWCASNRQQHQLPQVALRVGIDYVTPTTSVNNIGIYVNSDVSMLTRVSRTVSSCFATLRQLRSIRRSTSQAVLLSLVISLVLSHLDYGNATLASLPGNQLDRLQSVTNATARLVCSARKYEHITPRLRDLHWLRVSEQIVSVLVFRCLHDTVESCMASELRHLAAIDSRKKLPSASMSALVTPSSCRTTTGDRPCVLRCCTLASSVTASETLSTFKRRLKTHLIAMILP